MIPLSIRSQITLFLCLGLVALGEARLTHSTKKAFQLILDPIHSATFAFYIIFGVATTFQALSAFFKSISALRKLGRREQVPAGGRDYSTGSIYVHLVFLGACSALVYDVLSTVWIVYTQNQFVTRVVPDAFFAGKFLVEESADFFICFAMLALVYHRQRIAYGAKADELRPYRYKLFLDAALLTSYLALIIVYASLRSVYSSSASIRNAYYQLLTADRVVIGLFSVLAVNITASSIYAWLRLKRISPPDAVGFFPSMVMFMPIVDGMVLAQAMLGQIVKFISPLLLVRAIFKIVEYVLLYSPGSIVSQHELDSVRLARAIIMGLTYFVILIYAL